MSLYHRLKPKPGKEIPFLILISFLFTFISSRLVVTLFPEFFLSVKGTHIHHFAYGIILLAVINFLLLTNPLSYKTRLRLSIPYGIALGLALDEFFMWIELEENYLWDRKALDPVIIVTLLLLNIIYFDNFWKRWGYRLGKLLRIITPTT